VTPGVEVVDPADEEGFAAWFAVVDAANRHRWPGRPGWQAAELRAPALDAHGAKRAVLLAAHLDGSVVGAAKLELPRHDNPHLAELMLEVVPGARRRGAGRALVHEAERVAAADGRNVLFGTEEEPVGSAGGGPPFAAALGYALVLESLRRDLAVPVDPARLAELEAAAAPRATGYEIVAFASWPVGWLEDRAAFGRHMSTDPPLGGLALHEEVWGPERVRRQEQMVEAMGRRLLVAAAIERASGRAVAFSELTVSMSVPETAWQWDTLVLPAHRGHRLGLLVKLANLARLAETSPRTTSVSTWNAAANDPMIAVNETLGARVVSVGRTWQRRI
jgi:GNAT superfamily N-acetyltransferase